MVKNTSFKKMDGSALKIGIAVSRWHQHITDALLEGCKKALEESQVKEENIFTYSVPGSWELPFAARELMKKYEVDAVVCLGCVIKGETMHFEYICEAVSQGIMQLNLTEDIPFIFGVLTCLSEAQAVDRSIANMDHGYSWGLSAVEMSLLE